MQLPEGTLGDAVGVLIFCFVCLFTNILLLWLFWISNELLGCEFFPTYSHLNLIIYIGSRLIDIGL